jgi:hypothetical protein
MILFTPNLASMVRTCSFCEKEMSLTYEPLYVDLKKRMKTHIEHRSHSALSPPFNTAKFLAIIDAKLTLEK